MRFNHREEAEYAFLKEYKVLSEKAGSNYGVPIDPNALKTAFPTISKEYFSLIIKYLHTERFISPSSLMWDNFLGLTAKGLQRIHEIEQLKKTGVPQPWELEYAYIPMFTLAECMDIKEADQKLFPKFRFGMWDLKNAEQKRTTLLTKHGKNWIPLSTFHSTLPIISNFDIYKKGFFTPNFKWFFKILSIEITAENMYLFTISEQNPADKAAFSFEKAPEEPFEEFETEETAIVIDLSPEKENALNPSFIARNLRAARFDFQKDISPSEFHTLMEHIVLLEREKTLEKDGKAQQFLFVILRILQPIERDILASVLDKSVYTLLQDLGLD